jgi:pimeloyl-ACP methyl ester carboxylesterase
MDIQKALIVLASLLICPPVLANNNCSLGVYSDGDANTVVLQKDSGDSGLKYLMLNGVFGNTESTTPPFRCKSKSIHIDKVTAPLERISLRQTLTTFTSVNTQLTGMLIEPSNPDRHAYPLIVMVHGSEQEPSIGNIRAQLLAAMGIAVFTYDKRGTGQSAGFYTQNFELLAEDAAAAMKHAQSLANGKINRAGFWGSSQGGWVAPLAATKTPVDFVVVSYGLVASPIEEDLDQMLLEAQQQQLNPEQLEFIRRLSKVTSTLLLSNFTSGFEALENLRKELETQQWVNSIRGEYSGAMLQMSDVNLKRIGKAYFDNLELIWDYQATPVLEKLQIPILWIIAEDDREAPIERTLLSLAALKEINKQLDVYIFPNTDHGMYEYRQLPDGSRQNLRVTDGYFKLITEWVHQKKQLNSGKGLPFHPINLNSN